MDIQDLIEEFHKNEIRIAELEDEIEEYYRIKDMIGDDEEECVSF
jgi:uncharacterized protein YydD (DUF2326 family)